LKISTEKLENTPKKKCHYAILKSVYLALKEATKNGQYLFKIGVLF
jgi:hypothetical protein